MRKLDETTVELGNIKPQIKGGLNFRLRKSSGQEWYLVEDEASNRFFQIGLAEYTLLSMLNGRRTLSEAIAKTASTLKRGAMNDHSAASLAHWAVESELVETEASTSNARIVNRSARERQNCQLAYLNPISVRVNLFNGDRLARWGAGILGWLLSWPVFLLWCLVVGFGLLSFLQHWDQFINSKVQSFAHSDFFWVAFSWLVLKVFHESAHAITCRRLGGRVAQCGILFLLLIPLPYVDVTSSWKIDCKWKRILTAAAGILVELFAAAIAILLWTYAEPGPLKYHAGNLFIAATLHTIIFNANPLMRFDGYYVLVDLIGIPNLYTLGRNHVKTVGRNLFFDLKAQDASRGNPKRRLIQIYGWAALIWSTLICVTLTIAAANLINGVGLIVAMGAAFFWVFLPLAKVIRLLIGRSHLEHPNRKRFALVCLLIFAILSSSLYFLPSPNSISVPVVVEYGRLEIVRNRTPGFVRKILVEPGDEVHKGQLLVQLENLELVAQHNELKQEKRQSELMLRHFKEEGEIGSFQQQLQLDLAIQKKEVELTKQINNLQVYASSDGIVINRQLHQYEGSYAPGGSELMKIGNPDDLKLMAMLSQEQAKWLASGAKDFVDAAYSSTGNQLPADQDSDHSKAQRSGDAPQIPLEFFDRQHLEVTFELDGMYRTGFSATLNDIKPKVIDSLPHAAFAANYGGPLSVVDRQQVDGVTTNGFEEQIEGLKLTSPRLLIDLKIPKQKTVFRPGQLGRAYLYCRNTNLGSYLYSRSVVWVKNSFRKSHGL